MRNKWVGLTLATAMLMASGAHAFPTPTTCYNQPIALGVNMQAFDFALIRATNSGWVRVTFPWRDINPQSGVWNWGTADGIVNNAQAQGLKILAILSTAPVWAGSNSNGTRPPSNVGYWEEFVRRVAQRYAGRIAAYEIWNEPNLTNGGVGIGWDADLWQAPRYADYLRAAAIQIRTYAPGTLVVGPATSSQPNARTVEVFKQLEQVTFSDGPASKFLDVVSFHANAGSNETSYKIRDYIQSHLSTLSARNPSNRLKPIWLTEFGWRTNAVGEGTQRDRIEELVAWLAAPLSYQPCSENNAYKWTHAFIYRDVDSSVDSRGIHWSDKSPKWVVRDYMWSLPYPAKHLNDGYTPFTFTCSGRTCTFTEPYSTQILPVEWDFGDGTFGSGQTVVHTFSAAGQYFVGFGMFGASDMQLIRVN